MAVGYTRQSSGLIITGAIIEASHFNNEYNAIESAMNATTGHNHDGTAGGGSPLAPASLSGLSSNGMVARTNAATFAARTITGTANEITVTNGTGVSGDPTLSLPAALTFTSKTVTGGTFNATAVVVPDGSLSITGSSDATKILKFEVDGFTAGNTRVITVPDLSDTIVTLTATQTLTNKTFTSPTITTPILTVLDNVLTVQDNSDNTKQLQFQLSGITTGNTRILTVPDASTTIVGTDTAQTLTNKTLTSPTIANIENSGTLTLPAGADTLVGRASTDTLTNKTLTSPTINTPTINVNDDSFNLRDNGDTTKIVQFQLSGLTASTTRTKTLQDVSGTLYESGGTDVAIADGGTGASTAANGFDALKQAATDSYTGVVELATTAEVQTGADTSRAVTAAGVKAAARYQGLETIWIPAGAMKPTASNGCATLTSAETTAGRPDMIVLDFDASADEHAQFQVAFPKSWNLGTITFQVFHTTTATDTDGVAWGLQGVACSDGDTIDVAYGTPVLVTDAYQSTAEDLYVTSVSSAVTIAGTPAVGDTVFFRIFRDVSDAADTAAEDARLIGIKVFFTTNASDDT